MKPNIQDNSDLPPELCVKPLALIGVSGLDTVNNAIHKLIWENFSSNRRSERAPVLFKLIGNAHEFPIIKPKRTSYDWYIPKGILKKNWMTKHLYEVPAVIVVFYDLDWSDPLWNEKMIECASRVQSMRAALEGRSTKLLVVLIQNSAPLPGGEDVLAADRAVTLCANCELTANSLYVLPLGDHLQGYVVRLENAFYEFAQNYYHSKIKVIRLHREHLNKNAHQFLFVRHQFKMGFIYELKQDLGNAHKHYTHAYNNLLEIRVVDTNALEIRTIAGFINYKLCRLMFLLNLPRDAISQFKAHVDHFKNRIGFVELTFEHYAWLAKQFSVFGDIFDEAVKQGLPAVQTQHPGMYYQQAAQYTILRKKSCQELCANVIAYPQPDPLEGTVEFYGQRPWRPGKLSGEPPDPKLELNGIQALQFLEKQVNHSSIIISLFGLAIAQYKSYKCPRTRRYLVLQMADEYYNSNDYGKALTLLTHMLWDFRTEGWWQILSEILEKALICAFLTANIQDYVILAFEILGKRTKITNENKRLIHENIHRILKRQVPFGHKNLNPDILQNALIQWTPILKSDQLNLSIDMSNILSCIETKARFMQSKYEVDQKVSVEIYIRCTCPFALAFSKISVTINTSSYSSEFAVDNTNLEFNSDEVKRFVVEFSPQTSDIMKDIQIGFINLNLSICSNTNIELKFNCGNLQTQVCQELLHLKFNKNKTDFDNITALPITTIVPRNSKLNVKLCHASPALLEEWYPIKITIQNEEDFDIEDLRAEINYKEADTLCNVEFSSNLEKPSQQLPLLLNIDNNLPINGDCSTQFYIRAQTIGDENLTCKISYTLDKNQPVIKYQNIPIEIIKPFEVDMKFLSSLMVEISKFYVGEEFGIMPNVHCLAPIPLIIEDTHIEFLRPLKSIEIEPKSNLQNMRLEKDEIGTELYLAVCEKSSEQNVNVGQYRVKWKRENGISTTSQLPIDGFHCEWIPLQLQITVPAHGFVRTPLLICYHLHNSSHQLLQLDVLMEASEAFMYAGYKQFSISVLPESTKTIKYNLYPLIAGSVALPKLVLSVPENSTEGPTLRQDQLKFLVDRCLPTHLYVMPQAKGNPKLPDILKSRKLQSL